jgi:DMSO/TMAO reductase YedYZ molybdopterin-dependent catalytic subunit
VLKRERRERMKNKSLIKYKTEIIAVVIAVILLVAFIIAISSLRRTNNEPIMLDGVEIESYQGKDLSSINDFRENSIKGPQYIDIENYRLKVTGLVEEEKSYAYNEVIDRQTYSKVVTLNCVEGWSVTILWEGIILRNLLEDITPTPEANTIIFHAYDGYTTAFPIEYILGQDILMAHRMNNLTMVPERGFPFQLVAEDKWGYRWIKWITEIEFSDDEEYEGFWESRGYSNKGNLNESYYD